MRVVNVCQMVKWSSSQIVQTVQPVEIVQVVKIVNLAHSSREFVNKEIRKLEN